MIGSLILSNCCFNCCGTSSRGCSFISPQLLPRQLKISFEGIPSYFQPNWSLNTDNIYPDRRCDGFEPEPTVVVSHESNSKSLNIKLENIIIDQLSINGVWTDEYYKLIPENQRQIVATVTGKYVLKNLCTNATQELEYTTNIKLVGVYLSRLATRYEVPPLGFPYEVKFVDSSGTVVWYADFIFEPDNYYEAGSNILSHSGGQEDDFSCLYRSPRRWVIRPDARPFNTNGFSETNFLKRGRFTSAMKLGTKGYGYETPFSEFENFPTTNVTERKTYLIAGWDIFNYNIIFNTIFQYHSYEYMTWQDCPDEIDKKVAPIEPTSSAPSRNNQDSGTISILNSITVDPMIIPDKFSLPYGIYSLNITDINNSIKIGPRKCDADHQNCDGEIYCENNCLILGDWLTCVAYLTEGDFYYNIGGNVANFDVSCFTFESMYAQPDTPINPSIVFANTAFPLGVNFTGSGFYNTSLNYPKVFSYAPYTDPSIEHLRPNFPGSFFATRTIKITVSPV